LCPSEEYFEDQHWPRNYFEDFEFDLLDKGEGKHLLNSTDKKHECVNYFRIQNERISDELRVSLTVHLQLTFDQFALNQPENQQVLSSDFSFFVVDLLDLLYELLRYNAL